MTNVRSVMLAQGSVVVMVGRAPSSRLTRRVPEFGLCQAVGRQLSVGGIATVDQDIEEKQVHRLAKVQGSTNRQFVRVV